MKRRLIKIRGLEFLQISFACPEQYNIYDKGSEVGYIRLRHGVLRIDYPIHGKTAFETDDVKGDGMFEDEAERRDWLSFAANLINSKLGR